MIRTQSVRQHLRMTGSVVMLMLGAAGLSGCAEVNLFGHYAKGLGSGDVPPAAGTGGTYKVGKPYQVAGIWYYPREDYDYDETGIASWYGPGFHAKNTANGEIFDQNAVSAAHKTLPLPSVVRVTNLENGRSLVIRVNDRGPFSNGRLIDLSHRAAQLLGVDGPGTAKVRVQILPEESRALAGKVKGDGMGGAGVAAESQQVAAAPRERVMAESLPAPGSKEASRTISNGHTHQSASAMRSATMVERTERLLAAQDVEAVPVRNTNLYVQAGAFTRHDNAVRQQARLSVVGRAQIHTASLKGQTVYRVRFGPMGTLEEADRILDQVIASGQQDAKVIVD